MGTDGWFYAEGTQAIGPMAFDELKTIFARISAPGDVLIWRRDFTHWTLARDIPELETLTVRPPPLRSTPPPLPLHRSMLSAPPERLMPSDNGRLKETNDQYTTIGGWLVLVAIGQVVGPLKLLWSQVTYYQSLQTSVWTTYPIVFYGEAVLNTSLLLFSCYTSYLFFRCSKAFPKMFFIECLACILLLPLDVFFSAVAMSAYTGRSFGELIEKMASPQEVGQWITTVIVSIIWCAYIKYSKRVAATFVRS